MRRRETAGTSPMAFRHARYASRRLFFHMARNFKNSSTAVTGQTWNTPVAIMAIQLGPSPVVRGMAVRRFFFVSDMNVSLRLMEISIAYFEAQ